MLNYNAKGSYTDHNGVPWIYYQDDIKTNIFYIVPAPSWVLDADGNPEIKVVQYTTDQNSGSGYVIFNTQLTVPNDVVAGVQNAITTQFPAAPKPCQINPLDYNPGCTASFTLDVKGTSTDYTAEASEFGSNVASFRADLDKDGMATIQGLLQTAGGSLEVTYDLNVPARLNSVTATLHFDSAIAYQYQVTHAQHHMYGGDTPRTVQKLLNESSSSSVHLQWGVENPSSDLVASVTDWANATIASLVSAEVKTALSLLSQESYDSFSVNEISSFTTVYSSDQVVNWRLYPKASLPAVAGLAKYTTDVNQRQQVMAIAAHLPFQGDMVKGSNVPAVDAKPVSVKQLTAKVTYPGLTEANSTYVFTKNESHTFTAPYSTSQGDSYKVEWTALYTDGSQAPVTGEADNVTSADYVISLPSVGILSISFEARQAFAPLNPSGGSSVAPVVTSIDIDFHFADPSGAGTPIHQKKTVLAPPAKLTRTAGTPPSSTQVVFTGYTASNVVTGTAHSYFVTYHFAQGPDFVGPETTGTSYHETIATPPAPHQLPLIVYAPASATPEDSPVDVSVSVWFETAQSIPGSDPQPTVNNPTTFDLQPAATGSSGALFARNVFEGFLNGTIPIMYSAAITTEASQITIEPTRVQNMQPSLLVNPTQRYVTVDISMKEVDWSKGQYDQITLAVNGTQTANGVTTALPKLSLFVFSPPPNGAVSDPQYATWSIQLGAAVAFTWIATYVKSGTGYTTATGSGTDADPEIIVPQSGRSQLFAVRKLFAVAAAG
jgi:hypothetical protein